MGHVGTGWRRDAILAVAVLLVVAPILQEVSASGASRAAATAAMWDGGTFVIDDYDHLLTTDYAEHDGHLYSDKAPGQSVLSLPFYALARLIGTTPLARAEDPRLLITWLSLWTAALPLAGLAVLMQRFAGQLGLPRRDATLVAGAMTFGTILLPFGRILIGHSLSAFLIFSAFMLLQRQAPSSRGVFLAGVMGGLAVATEYTAALAVVILTILLAVRAPRRLPAFVLGGLPMVFALLTYNAVVWGDVLTFSYRNSNFQDLHAQGIYGVGLPDPIVGFQVLFGDRGLFVQTPIVLVGVLGLLRQPLTTGSRWPAWRLTGLAMLTVYILLQSGWFTPTAGGSPGPRYVCIALPFAVAGVAQVLQRQRHAVNLAGGVGIVVMLLAVYTEPNAGALVPLAVVEWAAAAVGGHTVGSVLAQSSPWTQVAHLATLAMCGGLMIRLLPSTEAAQVAASDGLTSLRQGGGTSHACQQATAIVSRPPASATGEGKS